MDNWRQNKFAWGKIYAQLSFLNFIEELENFPQSSVNLVKVKINPNKEVKHYLYKEIKSVVNGNKKIR